MRYSTAMIDDISLNISAFAFFSSLLYFFFFITCQNCFSYFSLTFLFIVRSNLKCVLEIGGRCGQQEVLVRQTFTRISYFFCFARLHVVIYNRINSLLSSSPLPRIAEKMYAGRVPWVVSGGWRWQNSFGPYATWSIEEIKNTAANVSTGGTVCWNNVCTFYIFICFDKKIQLMTYVPHM